MNKNQKFLEFDTHYNYWTITIHNQYCYGSDKLNHREQLRKLRYIICPQNDMIFPKSFESKTENNGKCKDQNVWKR
jgi:hypothetical protein